MSLAFKIENSSRGLLAAGRRLSAAGCLLALLWTAPVGAQDAARWESEIVAFEAADRTHPPPKDGIVFTGSSSIRLWTDLDKQFPDRKVINRGFGGSHLTDAIGLTERIIFPYQPRQVVVYAGENDIAAGKPGQEVADDFAVLFKKIRTRLPNTRITFISIKPSPSRIKYLPEVRQANQGIRKFLQRQQKADYVDVFTGTLTAQGQPRVEWFRADGLHLNEQGYQHWAKVLKPYLVKTED